MSGLLSILGPESASEAVVRDHALRVVFAAPSPVEIELPPGIYRVDVWAPGVTDVELVAVRDGERVTHDRRELVADSAVPVIGIQTANERHANFATEVAAQPQHTLTGASDDTGRLLLFARSPGSPRFDVPPVSILDLSGRVLFGLHQDGRVDERYGCAGLSADLPSGHYVLCHTVPEQGTRAQVVRVVAQFETQVFAQWAEDQIDLAAAVICMPPFGTGFDPTDQVRYFRAEYASRALTTGRAGPAPDHQDPLITMMDSAARALASEVGPIIEAAGLHWTDLELLQRGRAGIQRWQPPEDPPVLDAAVPFLPEFPALDSLSAKWATGLLTASTGGSVWARWDLDAAPLLSLAPPESAAGPSVQPDAAVPSQAGRVTQLRIGVLSTQSRVALAAAEVPTVSFGHGRHVDIGVWERDDPPDVPPRAEVRVRIGVAARIYQKQGDAVWYGRTRLPRTASDAMEMTVREGENLLTQLAQQLRLGPED